jgi:hypothetical protein
MNCRACELALAGEGRGAAVEAHLESCAACRAFAVELEDNSVALQAMGSDALPKLRRVKTPRWAWPVAIAAMLALVFGASWMWKPDTRVAPAPPPIAVAIPPAPVELAPAVVVLEKPPKAHRLKPVPPLMVQMATADPDVVIYWQIDGKGKN